MSATTDTIGLAPPATQSRGWAKRLLIALHVPALAAPVVFTLPAFASPTDAALIVGLTATLGALQARHSAAVVAGRRPRFWPVSLLALVAVAYLPLLRYGLYWTMAHVTVIASGLMLLNRRLGAALATAVILVAGALALDTFWSPDAVAVTYNVLSIVMYDLVVGVALASVVRLVRVLGDLETARNDLTDLAVSRERLRVSRDLHDLLGQSLSAISLKGDLATRLLDRNATAARAEIEDLTGIAREALHGIRAVARDEHTTSLVDETHRAADLLRAAGIATVVEVDLPALPAPIEAVLAWGVRESVTNVLRHSRAENCTIRAGHDGPQVRLEVTNDGAGEPGPHGSGLTGLAERTRSVSGVLSAAGTDGEFRLRMDLPTVEQA